MKKPLLLLAALSLTMSVMAEKQLPERLYLVGTMNNWSTPDTNDDRDAYSLTDPDGDGTYTGSFDFSDAGTIEFKVFDAKAGWDDDANYFGTPIHTNTDMYSDLNWSFELLNGWDGYNISIKNWAGGTLSLEAKVEISGDNEKITLSGTGSNQPKAPAMAKSAYLTGTFNDWKLPENGNLNGAIEIPQTSYGTYSATVTFPKGSNEFALNYQSPENGEWTTYYTPGAEAPFMLQKDNANDNAYYTVILISKDEDNTLPIRLRDWNGTDISFSCDLTSVTPVLHINSATANVAKKIENINLLYTIDGGEWQTFDTSINDYSIIEGNCIQIKYSAEVDGTACELGAMKGSQDTFTLTDADFGKESNFFACNYALEENGAPFTFKSEDTRFKLNNFDIAFQAFTTYINLGRVFNGGDIYLIGSPQGWDINNSDMSLKLIDKGIYYAEFTLSAGDNLFRFYSSLGEWGENGCSFSYGSHRDDGNNLAIEVPCREKMFNGKGNWSLTLESETTLYFTVNISDMTLLIQDEAGVTYVGNETGKSVKGIFDLTGVRHSTLQPGINIIRYSDGTVSKVIK